MKVPEQPPSFSIVILAFIISILATISGAQSIQKKPTQKKRAANPSFTCPDSEAQQACKSYVELLKAKETGLPSDAYVCFRKSVDEFFLVAFSQPYFRKKWDPDSKQMVVDFDYAPTGMGNARTYKNGIEDLNVMPSLIFSGRWSPGFESEEGVFISDKINFEDSDKNDHDVGVSIYASQVNIGYKYKNKFEKTILYSLTIQRSTGRFAEKFYEEASSKIPFSEGVGYCVRRTGE